MTQLNRRDALTAVATLPALAVPTAIAALPGSDYLGAAARAVESCWRRVGHSCDVLGVAEQKHQAWVVANPKPERPAFPPMDLKETVGDMIMRMRELGSDQFPEAGEQQKYERRVAAWELRSEAAEDQTGVTAAIALQEALWDEMNDAEERLAATSARTLEELRCKARVSHFIREHDNTKQPIAESIIKDLLAL